MYIYLLIFVLLVIAFFDLYWILRLIMTRLLSKASLFLFGEFYGGHLYWLWSRSNWYIGQIIQ